MRLPSLFKDLAFLTVVLNCFISLCMGKNYACAGFDGGFNVPGLKERLLELYNRTQPNAAVFNGCGECCSMIIDMSAQGIAFMSPAIG